MLDRSFHIIEGIGTFFKTTTIVKVIAIGAFCALVYLSIQTSLAITSALCTCIPFSKIAFSRAGRNALIIILKERIEALDAVCCSC